MVSVGVSVCVRGLWRFEGMVCEKGWYAASHRVGVQVLRPGQLRAQQRGEGLWACMQV